MEVSYERQMRHNYLIIKADKMQKETYECRMLMANSIEGLLKFRFRQTEIGIEFYYEITSRQPLSRMLEGKTIQRQEIVRLISSIASLLERLESYLLQESQILLDPQYIYTDMETYQFFFCLVPDRKGDFPKDMERLLQYLMKKTDHRDKESALLSYRLYQESQKDFYGLDSLLKWLPAEESKTSPCPKEGVPKMAQEENKKDLEIAYQKGEIPDREEDVPGKTWLLREKRVGNIIQAAALAAVMILAPGVIWLLKGSAFLREYWYGLICWYGFWTAAAAARFARMRIEKKKAADQQTAKGRPEWEDEFSGTAEKRNEWEDFLEIRDEVIGGAQMEADSGVVQEDQICFETRVLSSEETGEKTSHSLVSIDKKTEDIPVLYFPFLIGKQSGIVDHILMRDTVSRIHVKIEKSEEGYTLTDLNSTNGTWVRGKALKNNETVRLEEGDEIYIADCGFRFL